MHMHTPGAIVAVSIATAEVIGIREGDTWMERLGAVGVLVVAAYFMMRWFMAQLEKKDSRIEAITALKDARVEALTAQMMTAFATEIRESSDAKRKVAEALSELTMALRQQR